MQEKDHKNYRGIVKGTAIFGGVQVANILINIIRGKLVAMILGPEGMGISSLLSTASMTIQQFSSLGINNSVVRSISQTKETENEEKLGLVLSCFQRLLLLTAFFGAFITLIFSKKLSYLTFGNGEYQWAFILLSIAVFFSILTNGEIAMLQGLRQLKRLALCSVIGPLCGLLIGIPLYYWKGYDAIVPAMIVLSLATFTFNFWSTKKISQCNVKISWRKTWTIGKVIVILGIVMMGASVLGNLTTYLLNTFIRTYGSLSDVGLFQAANSITNQYIGLVFTAMATDFYPRLSAISSNNDRIRELVNQQSEIVLLVVVPLAMLIIITTPLLIRILLTDDFASIVPIIRFMGLGVIFKAIAFPMGYISFSKGDKMYFFSVEGIYTNLKSFFVHALFYYFWGFW